MADSAKKAQKAHIDNISIFWFFQNRVKAVAEFRAERDNMQIIIQVVFSGFRIAERPIPTYYGDEICYVNGLKYALDVVNSTIIARVQDRKRHV